MTAGAIYRTQLAAHLQKALGVEIEAGKQNTFEVKNVSKPLCDEFSKRRAEIEKAMEKEGARGAARAAYFTLTTREKKGHVAREILFENWGKTAKEHGFDYRSALNRQEYEADKERLAFLQNIYTRVSSTDVY